MKWMILFTKHDFVYKMLYIGDGRKKTRNEKILRLVGFPSPFYDMEADSFPMSEDAENRPDPP